LDGLYIGGEQASQDEEAITDNKVTRIVNCCGKQVNNAFEIMGIVYLTYSWADNLSQVILDPDDKVINKIYNFIEDTLGKGDGVLVHSFFGNSRSVCVVCAYLMKKYRWGLRKAEEFLKSRQLEMFMKENFREQLLAYESRLETAFGSPLTVDWEPQDSGKVPSLELLLANTYMNVTAKTPIDLRPTPPKTSKLKWLDDAVTCAPSPLLERPPSPRRSETLPLRPALKGGRAAPALPKDDRGAQAEPCEELSGALSDDGPITIRTRGGVVKCNPEEIVHKRFGLKFECSTIILEYSVPARNLRAHHRVKVDLPSLATGTAAHDAAAAEHLKQMHAPWLNGVCAQQLAELVGRLRSSAIGDKSE